MNGWRRWKMPWTERRDDPEFDLDDPVVRLSVIVALRKLGYTVEAKS